jgi:ribosomal small subunit protein bTHX
LGENCVSSIHIATTEQSTEERLMGRGDKKTRRGKVARGTRGKTRPKHGGRKKRVDAAKAAAAAAKAAS